MDKFLETIAGFMSPMPVIFGFIVSVFIYLYSIAAILFLFAWLPVSVGFKAAELSRKNKFFRWLQ